MRRLLELQEKRGKAIKAGRDIVDKAGEEKRDLTDEENDQVDKYLEEAERLRSSIETEKRLEDQERAIAAQASAEESVRKAAADGVEDADLEGLDERHILGLKSMPAFRTFLRTGEWGQAEGANELRALQADVDTAGGYLVPPVQFIAKLIKFVDDMLFIRGLATVIPVDNAQSLGAPSLDTDASDSTWTTEILTGSADSAMALGHRELNPNPLAKRLLVSNKLLRIGAIDVEALIRDRLAYKIALPQEKAYMTGSGAGQPLGVFTAHADGISTSRDVSTGNTTTAMTFDGLIECKYGLKSQYYRNAQWIFHRDGIKMIAKLKDGEGQYLWSPARTSGDPDMLLGFPVNQSENAPNTFTTGLYVGMLGDFSHYWIADALSMQIQRLVELYAATNQVGFIVRYEGDGMPTLEEAFSRVTLA